ncbi:MAG: hypothetical protein NTZ65_04360 [Candidatus Berkelbacteria bacterium]|nr:hypothetical protein [Candidatus Berkelbacteria bacterium]
MQLREKIDSSSISPDFDSYFTENYKKVAKQSNTKSKTIDYNLLSKGILNYKVEMQVPQFDEKGEKTVEDIAVFELKKEGGKYKINNIAEIDPRFCETFSNILPVPATKNATVGENAKFEKGEFKVDKIEKKTIDLTPQSTQIKVPAGSATPAPTVSPSPVSPALTDMNKIPYYEITVSSNRKVQNLKYFGYFLNDKGDKCGTITQSMKSEDNKKAMLDVDVSRCNLLHIFIPYNGEMIIDLSKEKI